MAVHTHPWQPCLYRRVAQVPVDVLTGRVWVGLVVIFFFLRHLYNTATLNPIHLKSIFPQSTSTALFISHTPERTKIIHISLWAGVNLQTDPAAHTKTRAILIPNSTFNWGRLTSPAQNRFLTFTQEAVHKSPFNSTSHLLETLTKKKKRNPRLISVMW